MTIPGQLARYRAACNNLLHLFCEKQGFPMSETYWIADRIGEVADCARFCFSMDDIITDLEEDAHPGKILEWYDKQEELGYKVNYRHWLHGCPTPTKEELEEQRKRMKEDRKFLEEKMKNYDLKINKLKVTP